MLGWLEVLVETARTTPGSLSLEQLILIGRDCGRTRLAASGARTDLQPQVDGPTCSLRWTDRPSRRCTDSTH
eukprot:365113-Chlamydomonas_euryale.AAC.2